MLPSSLSTNTIFELHKEPKGAPGQGLVNIFQTNFRYMWWKIYFLEEVLSVMFQNSIKLDFLIFLIRIIRNILLKQKYFVTFLRFILNPLNGFIVLIAIRLHYRVILNNSWNQKNVNFLYWQNPELLCSWRLLASSNLIAAAVNVFTSGVRQ